MRHLLLATILVVALGCSNNTAPKNGDPNSHPNASNADSGGDSGPNNANNGGNDGGNNANNAATDLGGPDQGPPSDMGVASPCPDALPANGAVCDTDGLQCEFGDDLREDCRARAECSAGSWTISERMCDPLPAVVCPMTREDASGAACDVMDAYCRYDRLVCHCTNCMDGPVVMCGGDPTWMCDVPNPDAECPQAKPRLGQTCRLDGKQCNYACGPDGGRICRGGTWQAADGGPCPVSTAQVKRDIRYLSSAELQEISQALQSIPLARYEYTDPSIGRGEKLGFIIEDLPASTPAVDRDRMMVDLYGYTSMLVADAQAQQKRMRELELRLIELEERAAQCVEP